MLKLLEEAQAIKEAFVVHALETGEGRTVFDPVHRRVVLFKVGVPDVGYDWLSRS